MWLSITLLVTYEIWIVKKKGISIWKNRQAVSTSTVGMEKERRLVVWDSARVRQGMDTVFSFLMTPEEKAEQKRYYEEQFQKVTEKAVQEEYDVLFLDELVYTIGSKLFDEQLLLDFLDHKPEKLEVILTGQGPSEALIERADYVSELKKIKHPFDKGLAARDGIER